MIPRGCPGRQEHNLNVKDGKGCATGVVPPFNSWDNCWNHAEVEAGKYVGAEAHDKILIDLPPVQRDLAKSILSLGKTVVLVVLNGGSIDIGPELIASDAAIDACVATTCSIYICHSDALHCAVTDCDCLSIFYLLGGSQTRRQRSLAR